MQIYIGDELAETSALSPEEYGCHMRLRLHQWMHGELPTDEERLRRICSAEREQWPMIRDALAPLFDWQWHHVKTAELRRQSEELRLTKVENGKKGGRPRKPTENLNETETKPTGKANGKADGKLNETPSPSPSPSPSDLNSPAAPTAASASPSRAYDEERKETYTRAFPVPQSVEGGRNFLLSRGCPPEELKRCLGMLMEGHLTPFDIEAWDVKARANA
ncbi:DUF1376 domain-containing protein [Neorhizobium sp. T25_13]|uniref:DUF1376 domain-containing protein n=1 Tax=Neorhizobium sp. T25_13 TaxID=2093830 RepID=UPI000CF88AE4|nr:DUF1376 domain-containing protein [Neorhizobium sp. T25_13]